jgi:ribosomal-protein-alanine N-acetyltransferase
MSADRLEGTVIYLTPLSEHDVSERYVAWLNDPVVCRDNSHGTIRNTRARTLDYVQSVQGSDTTKAFAIRLKSTGEHVGNVSIQKIDPVNQSAELAILIGEKDAWGLGVGTDAYRLLIDYGFGELKLNRIYSAQTARNQAMIRVCEKVGMTREALLRQAMFKDGEYLDVVVYALLRDDYMKGR